MVNYNNPFGTICVKLFFFVFKGGIYNGNIFTDLSEIRNIDFNQIKKSNIKISFII